MFFPIMTIALDVLPKVARDFSFMIQVHNTICVYFLSLVHHSQDVMVSLVNRDTDFFVHFSIQSVGMTAAATTILIMKVEIECAALVFCSIGGVVGIIVGLDHVAPQLEPAYSKMYFVCIWFSFAWSLYWLNRYHDRPTFNKIPEVSRPADYISRHYKLCCSVFSPRVLML